MVTSAHGPAAAPRSVTKRSTGRGSASPVAAQIPPATGETSSGFRHSERATFGRVRRRLGLVARSSSMRTMAKPNSRQAVSSVEITSAGSTPVPNSPKPSGMPRNPVLA